MNGEADDLVGVLVKQSLGALPHDHPMSDDNPADGSGPLFKRGAKQIGFQAHRRVKGMMKAGRALHVFRSGDEGTDSAAHRLEPGCLCAFDRRISFRVPLDQVGSDREMAAHSGSTAANLF